MRLSSLAAARPAYYDRNASSFSAAYAATVAPHANTTRWTYTVASGKKLLVESAAAYAIRTAAATVNSYGWGLVTTYDGTNYTNILPMVINLTALAAVDRAYMGQSVTVYAGQQILGATWDTATGGTIQWEIDAKGTIYDA